MFIQIEKTPNPNASKFILESDINPYEPIFCIKGQKSDVELINQILSISGVESVFLGKDFITVTKNESAKIDEMKPDILGYIMDAITFGISIPEQEEKNANLSPIEKEIVDIIETRVRPSVAMDGGDIIYRGFREGVVFLEMHGACAGCPSSTITLKNGIENMLKHFIPEVESVEQV